MPFQEKKEQDHQPARNQPAILMAFLPLYKLYSCRDPTKRNAKLTGLGKGNSGI